MQLQRVRHDGAWSTEQWRWLFKYANCIMSSAVLNFQSILISSWINSNTHHELQGPIYLAPCLSPFYAPNTKELPFYLCKNNNPKLYVTSVTLAVSSKWKSALDVPSCHLGLGKVSCSRKYFLTTRTRLPIPLSHPTPSHCFTEHMPTWNSCSFMCRFIYWDVSMT